MVPEPESDGHFPSKSKMDEQIKLHYCYINRVCLKLVFSVYNLDSNGNLKLEKGILE